MSRFDLFFILVDECNEVTDYAIARRIVDLHSRNEESIERVYSVDEIQRYLTFARLFKPTISKEAQEYLVTQYKQLRQRDSSGVAKSSWRVTVRQLESMIRLSEALTRVHCQDEVLAKQVTEAYRLLNKSIIRVETPDIQFDEEEENCKIFKGFFSILYHHGQARMFLTKQFLICENIRLIPWLFSAEARFLLYAVLQIV